MSRDIKLVEKAEIDRPGTSLAELKALRAEGRMSHGPEAEVTINRYRTKPHGGEEDMEHEAIQGINQVNVGKENQ